MRFFLFVSQALLGATLILCAFGPQSPCESQPAVNAAFNALVGAICFLTARHLAADRRPAHSPVQCAGVKAGPVVLCAAARRNALEVFVADGGLAVREGEGRHDIPTAGWLA